MDGDRASRRRAGRKTRRVALLSLLVLAPGLLGCEYEARQRWAEAQTAWSEKRPEAYQLWSRLDPATESGREASRRLAQADALYLKGLEHLEHGDPHDRAREVFERAVALAPIDPEHYLRMAQAYDGLGFPERAATFYDRFIAASPESALVELARRERAELGVPADLLGNLPSPTSSPAERGLSPAFKALLAVAPALAIALALFSFWRLGRRRQNLAGLVDRQPELQAGVAYLVGSLRHELLKHRVGAAGAFVQAVAEGEVSEAQQRFLERRLFSEPGIHRAWSAHLDAFSRLLAGRLDVRDDPSFRRAERALVELASARPLLDRDPARAHQVIERSYRELRSFDGRLSALVHGFDSAELDHALLVKICREVRSEILAGEVALEGLDVPRALDAVPIRMFDADLRLVLKNLVRNAILASDAGETRRVAVVIDEEMEPTGEELVVIRVLDTGAEVSAEALRRRDLGSGLGLVCSVLERNGGSIEVERAPSPFTKAVALRLFRAYPESEGRAA